MPVLRLAIYWARSWIAVALFWLVMKVATSEQRQWLSEAVLDKEPDLATYVKEKIRAGRMAL